jgi:hypothetical protein
MCRPLNTGYADDLNLLPLDSVKMKVGVTDNQDNLSLGGSNRAFTNEFWLIL